MMMRMTMMIMMIFKIDSVPLCHKAKSANPSSGRACGNNMYSMVMGGFHGGEPVWTLNIFLTPLNTL